MNPADTIDAARVASRSWSKLAPRERRKTLRQFADVIASHQDELVSAVVTDTGKPALDALGGDILVTLEQMRYYHRHAHTILAPRRIAGNWLLFGLARFTELFEPHGVVLIYAPANYPLQLSLVPAITALYAGNAVVLKLSEQTRHLAEILQALVEKSALPNHLVQIVCDPPETAGDYVDARPDFICFTGSSRNGRHIAERAAKHLIPTLLELGGKDAAIVFADCPFDRTVEGVLYGAFSNSGQVCIGIKRLYIEQSLYSQFTQRLIERAAELRIATSDATERDLAPVQSENLLQNLSSLITDALARGANILGSSTDLSGATPLILTNVPEDAGILREESFGPVLCVAPFHNEAEAVQLANNSQFALGASIWTQDINKALRVSTKLSSANISVNDVIRSIANPASSFGGNQASGFGRYRGSAGLRTFSRTKILMVSTSSSAHERSWFPFTSKGYQQLRQLIRLRYRSIFRAFWIVAALTSLTSKGNW